MIQKKSKPKFTLALLGHMSTELKQRRSLTELFNLGRLPKEKKILALSDELGKLWDDLERCLPRSLINPLYEPPTLNKKIPLLQWAANINSFFSTLSNQRKFELDLPFNSQGVEVWYNSDNIYWTDIYSLLASWWSLTETKFIASGWIIEREAVEVVMKFEGMFQSIEYLDCEGAKNEYWVISLQVDRPFCVQETSNAFLLGTQLLAQRGGNLITPTQLFRDRLIIRLRMLRADRFPSYPPESLVSASIFNWVINYILAQVPAKYTEASQRLETFLLTEINRLEPYVLKGDLGTGWFNELQGILSDLILIREALVQISSP